MIGRRIQSLFLAAGVAAFGLMLINGLLRRMSETAPLDVYEFLIAYRGGFVRRGLIGELLFHLPFLDGLLKAEIAVKAICLTALVFTWAYLAAAVWRATASLSSALLVTLQPFLFGFPLLSFEWLRKDTLLVAAFFVALRCVAGRRVLLVNVISGVAILVHELYGVVLLPILMLVDAGRRSRAGDPLAAAAARTIVAFAPALIVLLVVSFHPGDPSTASKIVDAWTAKGIQSQSWEAAYRDIFPAVPNPAMSLAGIARQGHAWGWATYAPWFLYWPIVWACCAGLLIVAFTLADAAGVREAMTVTLVTAIVFLPLFAIALDWGRWIYVWSCATAGVLFSASRHDVLAAVDAARWLMFSRRVGAARPIRVLSRQAATGLLTASMFLLPLATMMQEPCCGTRNIVRWCLAYRLVVRR